MSHQKFFESKKSKFFLVFSKMTSFSGDLAEYIKKAKKRLHFGYAIKKEEIHAMEYDLFEDEVCTKIFY